LARRKEIRRLRVGRSKGWNVEGQRRTGIESVEVKVVERRKAKSRSLTPFGMTT
jgi:hypothetical protein